MSEFIITTLGRCGSSMLYSVFKANKINMAGPKRETNHLYPDDIVKQFGTAVKVIFLYGDPIDVVLSVKQRGEEKGIDWVKLHFEHLKADFSDYDKIYEKDSLCLERMFDEFNKPQEFDLLIIGYEDIWNKIDIISDFCRKKIKLPEFSKDKTFLRLQRRSNLAESESQMLQKTYASLIKKISKS